MTDDEIRDLVARLPSDTAGVQEGHVAIFKHEVERAGGDLEEVDAWMHRNGAVVRLTRRPERIRTGAPPDWDPYYDIPTAAFRD